MDKFSWAGIAIMGCIAFHLCLLVVGFIWLTRTESGWADAPNDADEVVAAGTYALEEGTHDAYYAWAEPLPESHLGSARFFGCCIVPKKGGVEQLVELVRGSGATRIDSIGSGPALLEWCLAEHMDVRCIDQFYASGGADPWCIPPVRMILRDGTESKMSFEHSGWGAKPVVVPPEAAMLWCWGVMTTEVILGYMHQYKGRCVVVIADNTCTPQPAAIMEILRADQPGSGWVTAVSGVPISTVGRPCQLTVFTRK